MSESKTAGHTPGPWGWYGNTAHGFYLATRHSGRRHVMGFARKGMRGAQPMFRRASNDGMIEADEIPIFEVAPDALTADDPAVYRKDIIGFRSADATLIAAAPSLLEALREARELLVKLLLDFGLSAVEVCDHPTLARIDAALHRAGDRTEGTE